MRLAGKQLKYMSRTDIAMINAYLQLIKDELQGVLL
jgi:hypothetical protein